MMPKILVSACLLGKPVRYNGRGLGVESSILQRWLAEGRIIICCPEVAGGLPVPRPPAEIAGGDGGAVLAGKAAVMDRHGTDISTAFIAGAQQALDACRQYGISIAVLAEKSPSCGSGMIYDGRFGGTKIPGAGVTTALLRAYGIRVFNQHAIPAAAEAVGHGQAINP